MAAIRARRRPQVNRGHVMARGLVSLLLPDGFGGVRDLCQPRGGSGSAYNAGIQGPASKSWTVASSRIADLQFTAGAFSAAAVYSHVGTLGSSDVPTILGNVAYTSESVNSGWSLFLFGSGSSVAGYAMTQYHNSATNVSTIHGGTPTPGDHWIVGIHDAGGGSNLYVDGASVSGSTIANPGASSGPLNNSGTATVDVPLYLGAAWSRALTAAEAAWWYRSAFDLLARRRGRVGWEAALAGTATTFPRLAPTGPSHPMRWPSGAGTY